MLVWSGHVLTGRSYKIRGADGAAEAQACQQGFVLCRCQALADSSSSSVQIDPSPKCQLC